MSRYEAASGEVGAAKPRAKEEQAREFRDASRRLAKTPAEAVAPPPAAPPPPRPEPASPAAGIVAVPAAPSVPAPPPPAAPPGPVSAPAPASAPPAPAVPTPAAVPAMPPAADAARAESKTRGLDAAGERERNAKDAEAKGKAGAMARSSTITGRLAAAPDVAGTLTVADRAAAHRALAELAARLGGAETFGRADAAASSVDLVVPGPAYAELAEGLGRIGRWQPDSVPSPLPAQVRVTVRLAAP
jgi:hypothetical protein